MEIELPPLNGYMGYCLGFMWGMFLIDSYIDWRQYKCICRSVFTDLNDLLRSHFEKEHFEKSQKYAKDKGIGFSAFVDSAVFFDSTVLQTLQNFHNTANFPKNLQKAYKTVESKK